MSGAFFIFTKNDVQQQSNPFLAKHAAAITLPRAVTAHSERIGNTPKRISLNFFMIVVLELILRTPKNHSHTRSVAYSFLPLLFSNPVFINIALRTPPVANPQEKEPGSILHTLYEQKTAHINNSAGTRKKRERGYPKKTFRKRQHQKNTARQAVG